MPPVAAPDRAHFSARALSLFHLCDLDATAVAIAWQLLFARCVHATLNWSVIAALGLSVWLIYAGDRLMDVVFRPQSSTETRRHKFHLDHKRVLGIATLTALAALVTLTTQLRHPVLHWGLSLAATVAAYFAVIHFLPSHARRWFPKELVVGTVFAIGTCLAAFCRGIHVFSILLPGTFFAILCCLNCAAIEVWEWRENGSVPSAIPHALTLWMCRRLRILVNSLALWAAVLVFLPGLHTVFGALLISALAFSWLDHRRQQLSTHALRLVVDLPLLSPFLFLGLLR